MQQVRRLSKRVSRRVSLGFKESLESNFVRFRGIQVKVLDILCQNVVSKHEAPFVELAECLEDISDGVLKGSTVQVIEHFKGGNVKVCSPTLPGSIFTVKEENIRMKERESWTLKDVCQYVVVPRCSMSGGFFPDAINVKSGTPYQGSFVLCSHRSNFVELVQSLKNQFRGHDLEKEFVWIDIFGINQITLANRASFGESVKELIQFNLKKAMDRFEYRLVYLQSWFDPLPLKHLWCVYELFLLSSNSKAGLPTFLLAPTEEAAFSDRLLTEYDKVKSLIQNFDGRYAECSDPFERTFLHKAIEEQTEDGFSTLNRSIINLLRGCLVDATKVAINRKRIQSTDTQELAKFLNQAGVLLHDQGQHELAIRLYNESLFIYKNQVVYDDKQQLDLEIARVLGNIGNALADLGKLEEALEMYLEDLSISKRILGKHPEVATTLNNIAVVLDDLGKHHEAIARYEESLTIRQETLGPRHPEVAQTLNNIAGSFFALREFDEAEAHYQGAFEIYRDALGGSHPSVVDALNNLATVHSSQKRLDLALENYRSALAMAKKAFGPKHPQVASAFLNVGSCLDEMDQFPEALECYESALSILLERFGAKSIDVANTLNLIAGIYHSTHQDEIAIETYSRALAILNERRGKSDPAVAMTYYNMAQSYEQLGKIHEAMKASQHALRIYTSLYGDKHQDTLDTLRQMSHLESLIKNS